MVLIYIIFIIGSVVLDACAAPGMKTSQLAGKYFTEKNTGSVSDPILYFTRLD
jgi:hypothetical protein